MELNQVVRRVLGQHWRLILCFVVVICGVAAVLAGGSRGYTASARLVLDTADPKARTESESIADTAKALATSPTLVKSALKSAKVEGRDPVKVAARDVSVSPLGTSGVLRLDVTDRDRHVAAALANALAAQVIRTRLSISNGELKAVLDDLDRRLADINGKLSALEAQPGGSADAARLRDFLAQQRSVIESERITVLSSASTRPKPSIVSRATPPLHADGSRRLQTGLLAAIIGLILGVGLAALRESFQPTLVGGDTVARALGVPLLGTISVDAKGKADAQDAAVVASRLRVAARSQRQVSLVAARSDIDVNKVADWLDQRGMLANWRRLRDKFAADQADDDFRISGLGFADLSMQGESPESIAIVSPPTLSQAQLDRLADLLGLLSVPAIGLIVYAARNDRPNLRRALARVERLDLLGRNGKPANGKSANGKQPSRRRANTPRARTRSPYSKSA
jgi:capsular polysaccharide biosynthesis protein